MSSTTYPKKWPKTAILANEFNFLAVKSRIHCDFGNVNKIVKPDHFANPGKMYATREQFRHVTKMVCGRFRGLTKTYHLGNVNKLVTFCHQFAVLGNMVRNFGQLPQPFWLGAACGGGSHSLSASVARA